MLAAADAIAQRAAESMIVTLFEQYQRPIFAYLLRLVGDREWAEELAQETFLAAFRAADQLPGIANHRAWLYRIATNAAFNALKRRRRFAWLPWLKADDYRLKGDDPSSAVARRDAVERALLAVPPPQRAALLLYSHYGLSVAEVAEALGIEQGAVKTRLYRARIVFREAYEREAEDESSR
jgi:RNA polymerase sigma-70 factor (ECF subfamily)